MASGSRACTAVRKSIIVPAYGCSGPQPYAGTPRARTERVAGVLLVAAASVAFQLHVGDLALLDVDPVVRAVAFHHVDQRVAVGSPGSGSLVAIDAPAEVRICAAHRGQRAARLDA